MTDNEIIQEAAEAVEKNFNAGCYVGELLRIIKEKNAEIERLTTMHSEMCIGMKRLKSEAIKEFAERLKEIYVVHEGLQIEIDNLVKEMTEPAKVEHNSLCETETYIKE